MSSAAPWVMSQVQVLAEAVGTVAFAQSGVIEAARKRLDEVGICVVGSLAAFGGGMPAIVGVLLGMMTAVFGEVLRDVVCNAIPRAFNDHRPYAVCSFAGGWILVAAQAAVRDANEERTAAPEMAWLRGVPHGGAPFLGTSAPAP